MAAMRFEPFTIRRTPFRARGGGANVRHFCARFDQQARHQQFRTFITGDRNARLDRIARERSANGRQCARLGGFDFGWLHAGSGANGGKPGIGAFHANRRRANHRPASRAEFTNAGSVEGMHCGHRNAIQSRVKITPFTRWGLRRKCQPHGLDQRTNTRRIGGE